MSKIYMLIADNGQDYEEHRWWNVRAFASEKKAYEYIKTLTKEINYAKRRVDELEELWYDRGCETAEERVEYNKLNKVACRYWDFFDHGKFIIQEFEVFG